jgi:hypothetical protein
MPKRGDDDEVRERGLPSFSGFGAEGATMSLPNPPDFHEERLEYRRNSG